MWNVFWKELLRRWRSPVATAATLIFPFMMALMVGMVASGGSTEFPTITIFLQNQDEGVLSDFLVGTLTDGPLQEYVLAEEVGEEGRARMENGDASAMVIFPAGMTEDLLAGRQLQLQVIRNPAEGIKPEVIEQGVEVLATYLDEAAKLLGDELRDVLAVLDADEFPGTPQIMAASNAVFIKLGQYEPFLFPPLVWVEDAKEGEGGPGFSVFGYVLVMVSVMALLFVNSRSIMDLYDEEKTGMLRRQLAAPITVGWLVNGKILFAVGFSVLVMFLLLAVGGALQWIAWPVDMLGLLMITLAFSAAGCGILSIIYAVCRTDKQAAGLHWLVIMGMSSIGGSMTPVSSFPESIQRLSEFTINFWAIQGLNELIISHEPFTAVVRHTLILSVVAVVTMATGQLLMVRKFRRGLP